ncbi:MAG: lamin tail domain-containing protein [Bacteroidetes bacterium]|nr:lamin tail domain-containing protein [Bacteroidota bacterium]MCL2303541.1 lamin tail domain-containing protein [Lentimicrobiaceae bacterium]
MKKFVVFLSLSLAFFLSFSQIHEHFLEDDFLSWVGNRELFIVNANHQLQLNATESGTAYLSLHTPQFYDVWEWSFYIRLNFSPSNNNFARIYLTSNTTDLTSMFLKAYYLQFGENLAQDAIELFYQNGTSHISICRGKDTRIANRFAIHVKVRYTEPNHWEILVDETLNGMYETDASGVSVEQFGHVAMGIYCKYTVSNIRNFFFDDFYYGPPIVDTVKPKVLSLQPQQDGKTLHIKFSKNVTPETALLSSNYLINDSIQPEECDFVGNDFSLVKISCEDRLKDRIEHAIQIENIYDMADNKMEKFEGKFCFAKIRRNDILITEIMARPSPVVRLPDCEYIELHNFGVPDTVVLKGWRLRINNANRNLPEIRIPPNQYVFLVANSCGGYDDETETNMYRVSSLGIAMAGVQIVLFNEANEVIHEVKFSSSWHRNKHKADGGWSLEMIDPRNPCTGGDNWDSSMSELGGTPGKQNSIYGLNPDLIPPEIEKITVADSMRLRVFFTETIFYDTLKMLQLFEIDKGIKIASVSEAPPNNNMLQLHLQNPIQSNVFYTLTLKDTVWDCVQNPIECNQSYRFALPSVPQPFDVVINEVLFNAKNSTRAEFVELYNRSQKVIDLASLRIGSGGADLPDRSAIAVSSGFLLFPNEYVALCKHKNITEEQYNVSYPNRLVQCDSLPSYTNSSGVVFLSDRYYNTIDRFQYDEKMHYPLLTSVSGVSLERVNFNRETQNANNWKSAAEGVGFATPGYKNSQSSNHDVSEDILKIVPEIFSPNQTGISDYVEIHCSFEETENRVSITIFDRYGNLIKTIANNQICALNEIFLWDGVSEKSYRVPPDLYIVKMDYWNLNTKRKTIKKTVGVVY